MSSPTTGPRARSRLRATARWSLSHTTTLPVPSCSPASPMLRIVRSSPSCCPLPRLPLLPLPSCVSCRSPARSRFCCGLSRSSLPSLRSPTRQTSFLTATFFPIRPARCVTSLLSPLCSALWTTLLPSRAKTSFPTMFRSIPILGSRSVVPRRWRAQQRSMPRPNSKTTTATPSSMKSLPTPRMSSVSRLLPTLRPSPNRVRISTSRSRALRVRLPTRR